MTCAKAEVHAVLITTDGRLFEGTNWCASPQAVCPRAPGEGYEKCHSICGISAHAEVNAIAAAGDAARGSTIVVAYHYVCDGCQQECKMSDVKPMTVEEWLAAGNEVEKLGNTEVFKQITPLSANRATFNNRPPKNHTGRHSSIDRRRRGGGIIRE